MTTKTKNAISIVTGALPSAMLLMSAFMKLSNNPQMQPLRQSFGSLVTLFGIMEIVFVALFFIPRTHRTGLLFLSAYLGGAASIELSHAMPPMSLIFLTLFWISAFIKGKGTFLGTTNGNN